MSRVTVVAILVVLAVLTAPSAVAQSDSSYSVSIENAEMVETPERTIQGYTVSSLAAVPQGESIDVSVSTSTEDPYRVTLYNSDSQIASDPVELNGSGSASIETSDLDPGSYALVVGGFDEVQPVVLTAYDTTLSAPSESPEGENITAEISFSGTTPAPETVQAVIANDEINETISAEQTGDGTYEATIPTSYDLGDYRLYAVARNGENVQDGQSEIIAVSNEHDFSITPSESDDRDTGEDDTTDGGAGGGGGGGGGGGAQVSDSPEDESDDSSTEAADIIDEQSAAVEVRSDATGSQVGFNSGSSVEEITFTADNIEGTVNVTSTTSVPDSVEPPTQTTLQISEISVPNTARNSSAQLRMSVSADRLNQSNASAADLRVTRHTNGTWTTLNTTVIEETDDRVRIEATTPGFSYFAVTADSGTDEESTDSNNSTDSSDEDSSNAESNNQTDNNTEETQSEDGETDTSTPGFGPVVAIVGILLTGSVAVLRRRYD